MNAVGIDVSKGKSTAAILRPFGEVVRLPFDVSHDYGSLERLADQIICLDGESRVLMEATGRYHEPVAAALHERGIYQDVYRHRNGSLSGGGSTAALQDAAVLL